MCNILLLLLQAFMYILFITVFILFLSCNGSLFLFLFDEEFLKDHLGYQLMRTNPCSFYLNINRLETTVLSSPVKPAFLKAYRSELRELEL